VEEDANEWITWPEEKSLKLNISDPHRSDRTRKQKNANGFYRV